MQDRKKTKTQLMEELRILRQRNIELERAVTDNRRMEEDLKRSGATLRAFIDSSTIGMWCFRAEAPIDITLPEDRMIDEFFKSVCTECNETYARMMGTSKNKILQAQLSTVMPDSGENRAYLTAFIKNEFRLSETISHEIDTQGKERYFSNSLVGIIREGKFVEAWGTQSNITEQVQAEKALGESEALLESTIESLPFDFFALDMDGRYMLQNSVCREHWGNVIGKSPEDLIVDEQNRKIWLENNRRAYAGETVDEEVELSVNGKKGVFHNIISPIRQGDKILGILGVNLDVTVRVRAEEALRESEARFRSVAQTASDAIITVDHKGHIVFWNNAATKIFGFSADYILGKPLTVIIPERFRDSHQGFLRRAAVKGNSKRFGRTVEFSGLRKDGSVFPVELSLAAWKPAKGIFFTGIIRDITERKVAEEALRESEEKYRNLIDQSNDVIYLLHEGKFEIINKRFEEVLGYTQSETKAADFNFMDLVAPRSRPLIEERAMKVRSGKPVPHQYEFIALTKDGRELDVETSVSYVQYKGGTASQGILRDISERKQMEKSLRIERDQLKKILDHLNDEVIMEDSEYTIIYQNSKSVQYVGSKIGSKCYEVFHNRKQPCRIEHCAVQRLLYNNESQPYMYHNIYSDGRSWDTFAIPITDEKGDRIVLEIARDVSEQEKLRRQLMQSEKMSALGQLISGVAHELNNPLTGVLGYSQLLLLSPDLSEKTRQSLETITREAERAKKIVHNLLTFARKRRPEKKSEHINDIVGRTLDLRAYEMRVSNIEVIRQFDQACPPLLVDEHQLQQVFMNLIINAEQAMLEAHNKGRLEVSTKWNSRRKVVQIVFQDNGPGIPEDHLTKIFDPFFTTKPIGKGTGLGLSISYGIVKEHGGNITPNSKQGFGTTFTVELPYTPATTPVIEGTDQSAAPTATIEKKRVLVIDDETAVVDLVRDALEQNGYEVVTALNGATALEKMNSREFDAVLSDLKMPGKNGIDVYLYCKQQKPDLAGRFLFLTGDMGTGDSLEFIEKHSLPYLSKPFNIENLLSSVSQLFQDEI